jgi:Putative T7SS secretion signal domain
MSEIVIPGSPDGLRALVAQLNRAADDIDSVRARVAGNGLDGSWSGRAAEAFRSSLHQFPGELGQVGAAFTGAAAAIGSFVGTLAQLQAQARWYDERVAGAEQELQTAHAKRSDAERQLSEAHRELSTAADPVSLSSARQLVSDGEGLVRQAALEVVDIGGSLRRLVAGQQTIVREYDDAVRACAAALNAIRDSGGSALHGLRAWVDHEIGQIEDAGAALWRDARRDALELGKDIGAIRHDLLLGFDNSWHAIRAVLQDVSEVVGFASIFMLLVPGIGPLLFLIAAGISLETSAFVLEGDMVGTALGSKKDERHLLGDTFDTACAALSFIPMVRAARDANFALRAGDDVIQHGGGPIEKLVSDRFVNSPIGQVVRHDHDELSSEGKRLVQTLDAAGHSVAHHIAKNAIDNFEDRQNRVVGPPSDRPKKVIVPLTLEIAVP